MEYILRTNTVSKKYTNYYAVDKVSISIKKGEIYGLIGENGAGKSTLMKMIAGLVEPSEGSVELFGNFVPQTERYRIGCVIESPALYAGKHFPGQLRLLVGQSCSKGNLWAG